MLYEMEAAYRPRVTGELDTQNFEKFPEVSISTIEISFELGFEEAAGILLVFNNGLYNYCPSEWIIYQP